ncbi:SGNH/GDSL hydrolase family protein [Mucisphaera calidilacus]|uniref:GDSL-like Lipase/Acylhydrolase n=1 Tax=Mucisphaera calidilacus TaxID=2527982 RepID=A0A518BVY1_9BACT|nr:SGNH/GDSL hydrolase family protein [Mucisphaera calidilacus]QDU71135.1 GDSL-like Lipase/Acylhydrolase [Mucisphaera calidilacus]
MTALNADDVVLFQGDSITDAARDRDRTKANDPEGLGLGYVRMVSARLLTDLPGIRMFNRGVSGDRIEHLRARWRADALELKPSVLSLMIGVNDTWHGLSPDNNEVPTPYDVFEETYRLILDQLREAVPELRLLLAEPFVLPCGAGQDLPMRSNLDPRREIVHKLATEYDATLIHYQDVFDEALERAEATYWAEDGVHPSLAGHRLMADAWLAAAAEL